MSFVETRAKKLPVTNCGCHGGVKSTVGAPPGSGGSAHGRSYRDRLGS